MRNAGEKSQSAPNTAKVGGESSSAFPASESWQRGRRLLLRFAGDEMPVLAEIEFKVRRESDARTLKKNHPQKGESFEWDKFSQALSLFFIHYLAWDKSGRQDTFCFTGKKRQSLAASLGDGCYKDNPFQGLFFDPTAHPNDQKLILRIIDGDNLGGRSVKQIDRRISVNQNFLPSDCVEIFWDARGPKPLIEIEHLKLLATRIRAAWGLPAEPALPAGEESQVKQPATAAPLERKNPKSPKPTASEVFLDEGNSEKIEDEESEPPEQNSTEPEITTPPIDHQLFQIASTNETWPDDLPILSFPGGFNWTLENAFEGVLVLGETGSGKSSGSGATIAESFLHTGFGGLILTVKTDEEYLWRKLCARCGREKDFVVVRMEGDWRLNLLAYEAQRPGLGGGLAKNLVSFCRNLLTIATRSKGPQFRERIWEEAGDQLLNATFELFLLAGESISFDRLAEFIHAAPTGKIPESENEWMKIPIFGGVVAKAKASRTTLEDKRLYTMAMQYWLEIYAGYNSKLRASITLGIYAMLDAFRGRDLPALISSETNLTPESILSGKIVLLDLPLHEFGQTGLLVQSAWKYLFQMALERHAKARDEHRRPVFLWEDEGQNFFSEHDHQFQATARSARVSRVLLSQNLPSFYKEFGPSGDAAANSVFGNLNTKIFHANNDQQTNEWASKLFGFEIRTRLSINQGPPPQASGIFDSLRQMINPPSTTSFSNAENWEPSVRPEEFNKLRTGGKKNSFAVDAYITWPGLCDEQGRHFIRKTFQQNTEP